MRHLSTAILLALLSASASFAQQQGIITTVAGGGPNNLPATEANLVLPRGVVADNAGNLFISSRGSGFSFQHRIFKVDMTGQLTVFAGVGLPGFSGDGSPATSAKLSSPSGVVLDPAGNLFIADSGNHRIRRVDAATGIITTVAGTGTRTGSIDGEGGDPADDLGDGGIANFASFRSISGVALDAAGNLFIADGGNHRIRRVDAATNIITTVAGNGIFGFSGDGGFATLASLRNAQGVVVDTVGNLFIADTSSNRIRRVDAATGIITTVAGNGTRCIPTTAACGDGGLATLANFNSPTGVAVDTAGNLFIADKFNLRIRKVDAAGVITTVAGTGVTVFGSGTFSGDGGPATSAGLSRASGVAVDTAGNLFIADDGNNRIRRVDTNGIITTVAGNGSDGFSGEGGPATDASLDRPFGITLDSAGNFFFADLENRRIRRVEATTSIITTVAGSDAFCFPSTATCGDGGLATLASLSDPTGVALDTTGNLFIADGGSSRIRRVDAVTGIITTVAGSGIRCSQSTDACGDGGLATLASLNGPQGVAVDAAGNLLIADRSNNRIRKVDAAGIITTVAGTGTRTGSIDGEGGDPADDLGDGGLATSASLMGTSGVVVDAAGNFYFTDLGNARIRRVDTSGIITTVAGNGSPGFSGDGGPATSARLSLPFKVALDAFGNLFIADNNNERIRCVAAATGIITTVAGTGIRGFSGDGGPATNADLDSPTGVATDAAGNLFIAESQNHRIRHVILPDNRPPLAKTGTPLPLEPSVGEEVTFDGSGSTDPDGTIVDYQWDFGDGNMGAMEMTSHTYATGGDFIVTLTVVDDGGATDIDSVVVTVTDNRPPMASAGSPQPQMPVVGEEVIFDASGSTDSDGTIVDYQWDFGDGNMGAMEMTSHAYAAAGDFTVTLTVIDDDAATDFDTVLVTVITLAQATQNLIETVIALDLSQGIETSQSAILDAVNQILDDVNENNDVAAINMLVAFIEKVEAQRGKAITEVQADELVAAAQAIIDVLSI